MDTINHTTQGIILSYTLSNDILFGIILGLTAMIPDVYGNTRIYLGITDGSTTTPLGEFYEGIFSPPQADVDIV